MTSFINNDPSFYGTNIILLNNTICNTVNTGTAVRQWRDDSQDASFNTEVTRSSEQAYIGDYSVKIKCLNTASCKATFYTYGSLVAGVEYEFSYKTLFPTDMQAHPLVLQAVVGTTAGGAELGSSALMSTPLYPTGEWVQANTTRFVATQSTAFLCWQMYSDHINDYVYIDNFMVRPKKLDWSNDT